MVQPQTPNIDALAPPNPAGIPPYLPQAGKVPGWLSLTVALLIVGAVAEGLYRVSPGSAYGFVLVVLLGYAATGGNANQVVSFFKRTGAVAGG